MTREQLLKEIAQRNHSKQSHEEQLIWFVSYQRAIELGDMSTKDIAYLMQEGVPKTTPDLIDAWLNRDNDILEPGEDPDEKILNALDIFYGTDRHTNP